MREYSPCEFAKERYLLFPYPWSCDVCRQRRRRFSLMAFKVLYSELQPCVLIACECNAQEPFLMLIRALNQTVRCGFCKAEYAIELASYVAETPVDDGAQPASGLKIKCVPAKSASDPVSQPTMN